MQVSYKIVLTFISIIWGVLSLPGAPSNKADSLRYEVIMNHKMLNDINLKENFINSIDITSKRLILISTNNQFYLLGWGGIVPVGDKIMGNIDAYAYTSDSILMLIIKNEICKFDSLGNLSKIIKLPKEGMGISAGKQVMYVYDRNKGQQENSIYVIAKGRWYKKLLDITTPINSIAELNDSILFASKNGLFSFCPKNKKVKILASLSSDKEIISIAVNDAGDVIYFATQQEIYALKDLKLVKIIDAFGGIIKYFNKSLIVFDSEYQFIFRIVGIDTEVISAVQSINTLVSDKQTSKTLINSDIINMVKQKLSDGLIINIINRSSVNFNLSVDSMIYLSSQNVSSAVIMAMKNAMKSKISKESNKTNH